ncbi:glycosyltransferase [Pontibacter qinzhouensis]|uniref:Glycosyltransferase n=1 Tax=Pontibacter qinzhouensis TaxID=2603253 RepID=A0A5C8IQY3_9BACT|nr:glycosyltransferase [Pontibacter qinzhouensis]TXK23332.1 glycosyltransferase [Pontibacter qinzhouensis]
MLVPIQTAPLETDLAAKQTTAAWPLVSVIIPCYNHGKYLPEAFRSVWQQNYPAIEIIVVDDGSVDDTRAVTEATEGVQYIYQKNKGLSAARNTGIAHAQGELMVFLDADDWLLPGALEVNVAHLEQNKELAFVSGAHDKVYEAINYTKEEMWEVKSDHYLQLLKGNYIGMHATVMYRRWVFDEFLFDVSLRSCEDYDLYLKITRKYPVYHHTDKIAAYRLHDTNMSGNIQRMLASVLQVHERQRPLLASASEREAFKKGKGIWKDYYCHELLNRLVKQKEFYNVGSLFTLIKYKPSIFLKSKMIKSLVKKTAPTFGLKWVQKNFMHKNYVPPVGKVNFGDFNEAKPFSSQFGYDRGGPVDRYYVENFLQKESAVIKGRVLEIGDNEYTLLYGGNKVIKSDILHVNDTNPHATLIGDISAAPQIPDNSFDCIVLTQTLHLIYDFKGALATCHRILKPGGALLLTVPYITSVDKDEWSEIWYWAFTDRVLRLLMAESFPGGKVEVGSYGNVSVATAFLYGVGRSEITKDVLDVNDPQFQVINTVKAIKA